MQKSKFKRSIFYIQYSIFNNQRAFTLIELILYMSLVTLMISTLIPFAWSVIGGGVKSSSSQEISQAARLISERIKYEVRNSNQINNPGVNSSGATLSLNSAPATIINLSAGKIRISENGGTNFYNLNSNDTTASNLTFTSYTSSDGKTKNIQFSFTLDENYSGTRQEYKSPPITVQSSVEVRRAQGN